MRDEYETTRRLRNVALLGAAALIIVILLVACGESAPEQGTVIDKRFTPQYTHWHDGGSTCIHQTESG